MRVSQERTLQGRLFQIAGAAERKPRAPNEMLQRVTERRLAEADPTVDVIIALPRHSNFSFLRFTQHFASKNVIFIRFLPNLV